MRFNGCRQQKVILLGALCALVGILLTGSSGMAGEKQSSDRVKVYTTAGKIDAAGKQVVTVDKNWHIYANPVKDEEFEPIQTKIEVKAGVKLAKVDIMYPAGKVYVDQRFPKIRPMVYEGKIEIPVIVQRAGGDVSPLDLDITFSACDANNCLLPSTVNKNLK